MHTFDATLQRIGHWPLHATGVDVLQVNLGRRCNQSCRHCHVEAGPHRTESMAHSDVDAVLDVLRRTPVGTLDLTGGAPELHPDFEYIVEQAHGLGRRIIDRCNLTVLLEPGKEHLVSFLADHRVDVVASFPYFLQENVDRQRGSGVFVRSLESLRRLNAVGYGVAGSGLELALVFNPGGAYLSGSQEALERQFRDELRRRHDVVFSRLYTITNMPIGRFGDYLRRSGNEERYWQKLRDSFNSAAVTGIMCRWLVSVGWDGTLYDCDFNQTLGMTLNSGVPNQIERFDYGALSARSVATGEHCFGCTAGGGSSCGGALV